MYLFTKYWIVHETPSDYADRYVSLKVIDQLKLKYGLTALNWHFFLNEDDSHIDIDAIDLINLKFIQLFNPKARN